MGTVKICAHELAKTPYYVEATGMPLYSLEELAYYLYENIYLIDEGMMEDRLYSWLEKELELNTLAEKLRSATGSGIHVYNQVMTILQASDYYSAKELNALSEKIKTISGMQTQERMKHKADKLLRNESYWAAIAEYERILSIRQNSKLSVEFYADVWNNLACCYAGLFLFEKSASCFENAYQFHKVTEYKEKACYARKLSGYGQEDAEELLDTKISEEFIEQAEKVLMELEQKSTAECRGISGEEFLSLREKKYG